MFLNPFIIDLCIKSCQRYTNRDSFRRYFVTVEEQHDQQWSTRLEFRFTSYPERPPSRHLLAASRLLFEL
jgi:hypothetical protein